MKRLRWVVVGAALTWYTSLVMHDDGWRSVAATTLLIIALVLAT